MDSNIKPVYQGLWVQGTDSTTTSLVPYTSGAVAGYTGLNDQGTTSTTTSLASSTYQYIGGGSPLIVVTASGAEYSSSGDSLTVFVNIIKSFTEVNPSADLFYDFTKDLVEYNSLGDGLAIGVTKYFDEYFTPGDALVRSGFLTSNSPVGDGLFVKIVKTFNEFNVVSDSVDAFPFFDERDSMAVMVEPLFSSNDSMAIQVSGLDDETVTIDVAVAPTTLAAVTNPSSLSNQFLPTVIIGGVTYLTNACTAPPPSYVITSETRWINSLPYGISTASFCDMTQSSMGLTYQGGDFSIQSQSYLGSGPLYSQNLGQQIQIYGLQGTITDYGRDISTSSFSYGTEGIFGNPNLNKPFNLITYGNNQYFSFLSNQYGLNYAPPINDFTTVRGMAQAIADLCDINLAWLVPDAPYHDVFGQSGITGWDALSSLAAQVGASVRWNGQDNYIVAYPDFFQGRWVVPSEGLLTGQFKYRYHQDLGYGVSGSGVLGIPTNVYFDPSVKTLPTTQSTSFQEDIEVIATVTKPFTDQDVTMKVDLDNDIVSVKIQILVPPGQEGGGQYVTEDPSIWFDLGSPSISNPYVKVTKVGNSYRNQLWVDYRLFPNLSAINNGNFVMSFGIVRRSLNGQFEDAQQDANLLLREIQARIAANVRYIKTYTGTFSCYFYGTIPLPGMWGSATYCGETIEGIIESVSLSNNILTVQVAQYFKINFLDRKLNWALTSGNYSNI